MNCQCRFCDALYPADDQACPVCKEPNPIWEKREAARLLDENLGDDMAAWTGVPSFE